MTKGDFRPPQFGERILQRIAKTELLDFVLGDLEELYQKRRKGGLSKWQADGLFALEVLDVCRPFILKKRSKNSNTNAMIIKGLKVSWRNMLRQKFYASIKIGGLAVGVASFIMIALFIQDDMSYDKHYENGDRIYRLINDYRDPARDYGKTKGTDFPPQTREVLEKSFPEVEKSGRLIPHDWFDGGSGQFRRKDRVQSNYEEGIAYVDPSLFDILAIPMVYGDRVKALSQPNAIVLSKSKADKYFPGENPIGKLVVINEQDETPFVVGGVMEDFPSNHHLQFDFFITLYERQFWPGEQTNWCCWNYNTYVMLKEGADPRALEEKLLLIRDDYMVKYQEEQGDAGVEDTKKYLFFLLQPIEDIHLYSTDIWDNMPRGDISVVRVFTLVAIFVLLLAIINFVNLSTAKSANRAKEVGLRKVIGSEKKHLIIQFLLESCLFATIAVGIGLILTLIALPLFNELANKELTLLDFGWSSIPILLGFILLISVAAGLYPAFYLSAFSPLSVLKGNLSRGSKSSVLRSGLVVIQFTVSISLIVGAILVHKQMQYILNKDLGFDKEQTLMIQGANSLGGSRIATLADELSTVPNVSSTSYSDFMPVAGTRRDQNSFWLDGRSQIDKSVSAQRWGVDVDYIETMGMQILEGRNFTDMASDSAAIIINETMAKELGLKDPIGKRIMNWDTYTVIGVVKDFHFNNMREEIRPLSLVRRNWGSNVIVKMNTQDVNHTKEAITAKWDEFMPNQPIRYTFLDAAFAKMYDQVKRTADVFTAFSMLAIFVACLGLFGLSAFMAEQRIKEISIRKVLGASAKGIFSLLSLSFLKLVAVALLFATAISWWYMDNWLADFKYQIDIEWWVFLLAGLVTGGIAMLTVSYESVKAIFLNPIKGLRSE